ncbi:MAG: phospholipid/cholesterol/gamma-HCH transport system permease protein [Planctomycetota bacterium]|jgi:phospholipid/cholesterol/gamma-HCH transport system permease protein
MADSTDDRISTPPFPPVTHPTITAGATLDRTNVTALVTELDRALRGKPERVYVDLEAVDSFDSAGLGGVVAGMRKAKRTGCEIKLRGVSQSMLDYFSLVSIERLVGDDEVEAKPDPVTRLGAMVEPMLDGAMAVCATAVDACRELFVGPFQRRFLRLDRTAIEVDHCAAGALPIIALIAFLLGLILAMQAYVQLRVWGAEIYIADMVGVSVLAEIGPLMTAIVLAARSGSRNAAQLGSMVVSEEIAAIEQMGIRTISFLVAPKVLACAFASVALSIVFDVVGMCGGALFAWSVAGIELDAFAQQLRNALHLSDFVVALCKAMTFGAAVGVVGCALGLRVKDGSEGVGRATTNAVVLGIFLVIVIDAVFVTAQRFLT